MFRLERDKSLFFLTPIVLLLSYFILFSVNASQSTSFQVEIFYAQEVHEFDPDVIFKETLSNPNSTSIEIEVPPGALRVDQNEDVRLTMYSTLEETVTDDYPLPAGKLAADTFYNVSFVEADDYVSAPVVQDPVTLVFNYTDDDISGINEITLRAYRWNGSTWGQLANNVVDAASNKVTATTTAFSFFALLGNPITQPTPTPTPTSTPTPTQPPGGGGGGGGGGPVVAPTRVTFQGKAYPKSTVTLLKDAQVTAATIAGADASFQISITGISGGNYIFSLYSEDKEGNRSSSLTFPVGVTSGATTNVSGIFIAPSIAVDKTEVKKGDTVSIFGQSVPQSEITIMVSSEDEFFGRAKADKDGIYLYNFDTSPISMGQHLAKSKASFEETISGFSKIVSFIVGTKNVFAEQQKAVIKGDLNNDKKVNLIDFSIAAYWYKRSSPPTSVDITGDGKVDLVDFSIMAFYWTG